MRSPAGSGPVGDFEVGFARDAAEGAEVVGLEE
jgi:hypothetical protein